jgi:hypothetical protein
MMYDDLNERPETTGSARERAKPIKPAVDREVEIPLPKHTTSAAVHAWLDGDLPQAAVMRGETSRDVEFWNSINSELDVRRRMQTPAYVYDRIMEALPEAVPSGDMSWWRKPVGMTTLAAAGAAAAIFALGAIVTALLVR